MLVRTETGLDLKNTLEKGLTAIADAASQSLADPAVQANLKSAFVAVFGDSEVRAAARPIFAEAAMWIAGGYVAGVLVSKLFK